MKSREYEGWSGNEALGVCIEVCYYYRTYICNRDIIHESSNAIGSQVMSDTVHSPEALWLYADSAHKRIDRHDDILDIIQNRPSRIDAAVVSFLTMALGSALTVIIILIMFGLEKH